MKLLVIINTIFSLLFAIFINNKYNLFNNIRKYSSINNNLPCYYHLPSLFKRNGNIFMDAFKYKGDHFIMPCNLVFRAGFINYLTGSLHQVLSDNIRGGYFELSFVFKHSEGKEQSIGLIIDVEISSNTNSQDFFNKLEEIIEFYLENSSFEGFDLTDCYLGVTHKNVGKYF